MKRILQMISAGALACGWGFATKAQSSADQFVLAATDNIHLGNGIQTSSGAIGANGQVKVSELNLLNGDILANTITVADNTRINGSASSNVLQLGVNSTILGAISAFVTLPIIALPTISSFQPGTENISITGNRNLSPGDFGVVDVKSNVSVVLAPGVYNLTQLHLRDGSKLFFSGPTVGDVERC